MEREYLYWLCQIPVLGAVKIKRLWKAIGSFETIYYIEENELIVRKLLSQKDARCLMEWKEKLNTCILEYHSLEEKGIQFVTPLDDAYPKRFLIMQDYPMGLYVKGRLPDEARNTVAIIGARNCSHYGREVAEYMGSALTKAGIQVISGLAEGIDGAAHRGSLREQGDTYGVLGCGVNICYPKEHYKIYEAMIVRGGIISEYRLSEAPKPQNFPIRNRLISGFSDAITVIEAKERSGSLITVNLGLELGKEVFALPGRISDSLSGGCNQLIKDGANPLLSPDDILEYFSLKQEKILNVPKKDENGLAKKEKMVYSCLDLYPKFVEEIMNECELSVGECTTALMGLKLGGYIEETANHYYAKKLLVR